MARPFNGYNIPIAIQSTAIREYARKNDYKFSLPVTEITKTDCFLMLEHMFKVNGKEIKDLGVVSGFVLPVLNKKIFKKIFLNTRINKKLKIHLILENKVFSTQEIINWSDDILLKNKFIQNY